MRTFFFKFQVNLWNERARKNWMLYGEINCVVFRFCNEEQCSYLKQSCTPDKSSCLCWYLEWQDYSSSCICKSGLKNNMQVMWTIKTITVITMLVLNYISCNIYRYVETHGISSNKELSLKLQFLSSKRGENCTDLVDAGLAAYHLEFFLSQWRVTKVHWSNKDCLYRICVQMSSD